MKSKMSKGFMIAVVLVICVYILVTGIYDLVNRNDLYTINADGCVEILEVEHAVNGLIPIGKDHYYIAFDGESGDVCIVKASKRWYSKNFDEAGYALAPDGITITALAKDISDYQIERELISRASQIEGVNFIVSPNYSLDIAYKSDAICKIAFIVSAVFTVIFVRKGTKNPESMSEAEKKILIALALVSVVLLIKVVRGMM